MGARRFSGLCAGLPIMKFGVQIPVRAEIWNQISASASPLAKSAMMSTPHAASGKMRRSPSYAEAKKMKLLTFHTHGFPVAYLGGWIWSNVHPLPGDD